MGHIPGYRKINLRRYLKYILLRIHMILDRLHSLQNGWGFKFISVENKGDPHDFGYLITEFSTTIKWREELGDLNENRIYNIKKASHQIDKLLLKPGQIFSLFKIAGEAKKTTGYKDGPVIMDGKLQFSAGGGLCQVSSTLFNAALLANCEILEKHNHSSDIWGENRFIDLGRDATYVYGYKDLKFRNIQEGNLLIRMQTDEAKLRLNCQVYSSNPLAGEVMVSSKIMEELQPEMISRKKEVDHIIKGWIVATKRIYKTAEKEEITYSRLEKYNPIVRYK